MIPSSLPPRCAQMVPLAALEGPEDHEAVEAAVSERLPIRRLRATPTAQLLPKHRLCAIGETPAVLPPAPLATLLESPPTAFLSAEAVVAVALTQPGRTVQLSILARGDPAPQSDVQGCCAEAGEVAVSLQVPQTVHVFLLPAAGLYAVAVAAAAAAAAAADASTPPARLEALPSVLKVIAALFCDAPPGCAWVLGKDAFLALVDRLRMQKPFSSVGAASPPYDWHSLHPEHRRLVRVPPVAAPASVRWIESPFGWLINSPAAAAVSVEELPCVQTLGLR